MGTSECGNCTISGSELGECRTCDGRGDCFLGEDFDIAATTASEAGEAAFLLFLGGEGGEVADAEGLSGAGPSSGTGISRASGFGWWEFLRTGGTKSAEKDRFRVWVAFAGLLYTVTNVSSWVRLRLLPIAKPAPHHDAAVRGGAFSTVICEDRFLDFGRFFFLVFFWRSKSAMREAISSMISSSNTGICHFSRRLLKVLERIWWRSALCRFFFFPTCIASGSASEA